MTGILTGMGCEVECALLVTRAQGSDPLAAAYARCAVLQAPEWLPDGYYEATFSGQSAFLHRERGQWTEGVPWHLTPSRTPLRRRTTSPVARIMRRAS